MLLVNRFELLIKDEAWIAEKGDNAETKDKVDDFVVNAIRLPPEDLQVVDGGKDLNNAWAAFFALISI